MTDVVASARTEWRQHFMLPIAAGLGYATSTLHVYGFGSFLGPISEEFGWSRLETTAGLTIATLTGAIFGVPIGMLLDRVGPRPFGLAGIVLTLSGFALLSTATGAQSNWYMLWALLALLSLPMSTTVWTSAVASRFEVSRGLAFAVTLCGASVASALFPYASSRLIAAYGWRQAFIIESGVWFLIAFPIIFLFFRGAHDRPAKSRGPTAEVARQTDGIRFLEALRSSTYIRLLIASLIFTFPTISMVIHFVPVLSARGFDAVGAGAVASLIGLSSIVGRLGTGMLLDRFRGSLVGAGAFLLPCAGALTLLLGGDGQTAAFAAAVLIGLAVGAEMDIIVYLTTRYFGLRSFGALFGGLLAAISLAVATGPLGASYIYDRFGSYVGFLWLAVAMTAVASVALASLPRPTFEPHRH